MKNLPFVFLLLLHSGFSMASEAPVTAKSKVDREVASESDGTVEIDDDSNSGAERVIKIHHPNAAKGLISINEDKSYQYKVKIRDKGSAASFGLSMLSPPNITNNVSGSTVTFNSMYKENPMMGFMANYEWIPFHKYGAWGLVFESGLSMAHGNGVVAQSPPIPSMETYTLFVVPLTVLAKYRFEYVHKQMIVPFVEGGATYYGLAELRSDGKQTNIAGAPAAGGGGGLAINISRGKNSSTLALDREYGISDMWLNIEGRAMAGLKSSLDFTNTTLNVGVTVDY